MDLLEDGKERQLLIDETVFFVPADDRWQARFVVSCVYSIETKTRHVAVQSAQWWCHMWHLDQVQS
jgi:hypothetical protein